jgi:hypothetical protein
MRTRGTRWPASAGGARAALVIAAVAMGVLLLVIGWLAGRVAAHERARWAAAGAPGAAPRELRPPPALPGPQLPTRTPQPDGAAGPEDALPARASLAGTVRIDGQAPWRTTIRVRAEDGGWERVVTADSDGRFALDGVPAGALRVALEAEPGMMEAVEGRVLVLPEVAVSAAAGAHEVLDLDWTSRHVNVLVMDDEPLVTPARVELEGPSYSARFVTGANGRARIALVGGGSFVLRAELPSGRRGETAFELGDDEELDTVLVSTGSLRAF